MKHTMDLILLIIGIFLLAFTVVMLVLYVLTGATPDTLCTCVFTTLGGECGAMAWIKTAKEKQQQRQWYKEDRDYEQDHRSG